MTSPGTGRTATPFALATLLILAACDRQYPTVEAIAQTEPVPSAKDAADDAAIWIHAEEPGLSRIIATDKRGGLHAYALDGTERQALTSAPMNNVDLRQGVRFGDHTQATVVDVVAATNRAKRAVSLFLVDGQGTLIPLEGSAIPTGFEEPYGLCLFHDRSSERLSVFVNDPTGRYQQWALHAADPEQQIEATLLREFNVPSQTEGCAVDDDTGVLYFGEEDAGLFKASAKPNAPFEPERLDAVGAGRLVADVEGMAIFKDGAGRRWLIVSSQGDDSFAIYDLGDNDRFLGSFRVRASAETDGVTETDGLDVTSVALGPGLEQGMLVVQDDANRPSGTNQNFKLIPMSAVINLIETRAEQEKP